MTEGLSFAGSMFDQFPTCRDRLRGVKKVAGHLTEMFMARAKIEADYVAALRKLHTETQKREVPEHTGDIQELLGLMNLEVQRQMQLHQQIEGVYGQGTLLDPLRDVKDTLHTLQKVWDSRISAAESKAEKSFRAFSKANSQYTVASAEVDSLTALVNDMLVSGQSGVESKQRLLAKKKKDLSAREVETAALCEKAREDEQHLRDERTDILGAMEHQDVDLCMKLQRTIHLVPLQMRQLLTVLQTTVDEVEAHLNSYSPSKSIADWLSNVSTHPSYPALPEFHRVEATVELREAKPAPLVEVVEYVTVLHSYEATCDSELTLIPNTQVGIVSKVTDDENWWLGVFEGKQGLFPASYVSGGQDIGPDASSFIIGSNIIAKYDFEAEADTDLSFSENELLIVRSEVVDGWLEAENANGQRGHVPYNYFALGA